MMIGNEINHDQATKLAAFIAALRPEWDTPGIVAAIGRARERGPCEAVAVAAIRAAVEHRNRTPAVIGMDGPHWREPERKHELPVHPSMCHLCHTPHRPDSGCDVVESLPPDRQGEHLTRMRAALADVPPPRRYDQAEEQPA